MEVHSTTVNIPEGKARYAKLLFFPRTKTKKYAFLGQLLDILVFSSNLCEFVFVSHDSIFLCIPHSCPQVSLQMALYHLVDMNEKAQVAKH